jgi:hypothetical protein
MGVSDACCWWNSLIFLDQNSGGGEGKAKAALRRELKG